MATLAVMLVGGCTPPRVQQERDALWVQNQELQDELDRTRAALDASDGDRSSLLARLDRIGDGLEERAAQPSGFDSISGVETIAGAGTLTVRVPGDVLFASGQVELRSGSRQTLQQIARVLEQEHAGDTIRVEGYTDTDPIRQSSWADNMELSAQRALAVYRHLQEQGIDPGRMYAAAFGEHRPRGTKEQSRRVEIVVELRR
ncbi:MAG: OmpA family protein [Phycisphaeraceae bacterium]